MNDLELENETEYKLIMPFLTDNVQWVEGFESGTLYAKMENNITPIENYFHTANLEQINEMAQHFGYEVKLKSKDSNWILLEITKTLN
jgi:hypothetical protein